MNRPLQGLRVLEMATVLAGPAVGQFFAELGADVIKAEHPLHPDPTRGWRAAGETTPAGLSAYFCAVNWGKRFVRLDNPEHQEQLLSQCDILLMNCKSDAADKLGLVPEQLLQRYPRLLIGWITGYGRHSSRPGFDALIQAESGFMSMNGPVGGPPCKMPVALIDLLAAHQLKEGLLLALLLRERGDFSRRLVEVSLWETALASLANQATNVLVAGLEPACEGTEHPNLFPYGTLLPCEDGELLLAVGTDRQFQALCDALEIAAQGFETNPQRVARREELRCLLERASRSRPAEALLQALWRADVPAGQLRTVSEAIRDVPMFRDGQLAGLPTVAFRGLASRVELRPPAQLGADTEDVLQAGRIGGEP